MSERRRPASDRSVAVSAGPIVVKLGGSVVRSGELHAWLDVIAQGAGRVVVVPGGGALAAEVRASQTTLGFGDEAAHRMALLAMDQLAWAVGGLRSGFEVCDTEQMLRDALDCNLVGVWAPYALVANRTDIPPSWTVTSDSLSLWLAGRLKASACIIIKSIRRQGTAASAEQLTRDGVVDEAFPVMLRESGVRTYLLGQGDQAAFLDMLAGAKPSGMLID
jgi:dihydroneopterin aldolase